MEHRIEQVYVYRLDGKVTEEFWKKKSSAWRNQKEKAEVLLRGQNKKADQSYKDLAVEILELAESAHRLFLGQTPTEQRELIEYVASNCFLRDGEVIPKYLNPFDLLALAVK